jgi:hypothetical protein
MSHFVNVVKPVKGAAVETRFGTAVYVGPHWLTHSVLLTLQRQQSEVNPSEDEPSEMEPLCASELGTCPGCGAYWCHPWKDLVCVHCGSWVSLT